MHQPGVEPAISRSLVRRPNHFSTEPPTLRSVTNAYIDQNTQLTVYRQYSVLVDNKDAQYAESNWLTIQTAQKHIHLHTFIRKTNVDKLDSMSQPINGHALRYTLMEDRVLLLRSI